MKYQAKQLKDGDWAVFTGKRKYFADTVTSEKFEAAKEALEMSARWHQKQMDKCRKEWEELHEKNGFVSCYDEAATEKNSVHFDHRWSDILA